MSYTALYRKWRPLTFPEVRGQDAIVETLTNEIRNDRIGHAYLFVGTRGTGKTTIAKIFARAANCEHPVNGSPCNECATCKAILNGTSTAAVEIDAASNSGVDNIRDLREEVKYRPTDGKYRVYIIDEVHGLSGNAFNALLKTLEEPPEFVIFILATTEPNKVPITIASRCQRFDFKRLSRDELARQITDILDAEKIRYEEKAVRYIARQADGSSRDSLSLLERCIAFPDQGTVTYDHVLDVLGAVDQSVYSRMLRAIRSGDVKAAFAVIEEMFATGRDVTQFVSDFIWYLRNLMLLETGTPDEETLGVSKDNMAEMAEAAKEMDVDETMRLIRIFSKLADDLRVSSAKRVVTELAVIRAMQPQMETDVESLKERIRRLESEVEALSNGAVRFEKAPETAAESRPAEAEKEIKLPEAVFRDYELLKNDWHDLTAELDGLARSTLRTYSRISAKEENVELLFDSPLYEKMYENNGWDKKVGELLQKRYGKTFRLTTSSLKPNEKPPAIRLNSHIDGIEMEIKGGPNG